MPAPTSPLAASEIGSLSVVAEIATTKPVSEDIKEPSSATSLEATLAQTSPNVDGDQSDQPATPNTSEPVDSTATGTVESGKVSEPDPEVEGWEWRIFTLTLVRHGQVRVLSVFPTLPQHFFAG